MAFAQDKKLESSYSLCQQICRKEKIEKKKLYSCSRFAHNLLHYDEDCRLLTKFAFYKTSYNDFHSALNCMKSPVSLFVLKDF